MVGDLRQSSDLREVGALGPDAAIVADDRRLRGEGEKGDRRRV